MYKIGDRVVCREGIRSRKEYSGVLTICNMRPLATSSSHFSEDNKYLFWFVNEKEERIQRGLFEDEIQLVEPPSISECL